MGHVGLGLPKGKRRQGADDPMLRSACHLAEDTTNGSSGLSASTPHISLKSNHPIIDDIIEIETCQT